MSTIVHPASGKDAKSAFPSQGCSFTMRASAGKVSEETQELVMAGLRVIMERAPSTVVEDLTDRVTRLAGKYGRD